MAVLGIGPFLVFLRNFRETEKIIDFFGNLRTTGKPVFLAYG